MTPEQFIDRWKDNSLSEKGGAQGHFEDLCQLLDVPPPREYGEYCYEQDLQKMHGGIGFADVWKRGCFAWENKGPDKDLGPALMQLKNYSGALDNPPVLVVCNRERIEIHPCFTGYPSTPTTIFLEDIGTPENLQTLRWLFSKEDVIRLRPLKSNAAITQEAAGEFAKIAFSMRQRGLDSQQVAHFLIQCIFCMYAEDEAILHQGPTDNPGIFTAILKSAIGDPSRANNRITRLFQAMQGGGVYGNDDIAWFNGGLFNTIDVPDLLPEEIIILRDAAEQMDWRAIDPTIFGTLFERGLDPSARAPLGAHYTDVETIQKLIHPLIVEPLQSEWEAVKPLIHKAQGKGIKTAAHKKAVAAYQGYLERLRNFRVLDPACGSGNFLYLSMHALKDLEHAAQTDAEIMGLGRQISIETGPVNILGMEINEYAAELARVTVWIGDIQWSQKNGRQIATNPILRSLDGIQHRDALVNEDGSQTIWPSAEVIVGNPPFLGDKKMKGELGKDYVELIRSVYKKEVPGGADLVCFWFPKAKKAIIEGHSSRAGFVATNSVRGGANRRVLDDITSNLAIYNAWDDVPWINDGAAVRVSLICFGKSEFPAKLNGVPAITIFSNLTASDGGSSAADLTSAKRLAENKGASFQGVTPSASLQRKRREELGLPMASFNLEGEEARQILMEPANVIGQPMSDVVRPYWIAEDITGRPRDRFIINFGTRDETSASMFERPFAAVQNVRLHRAHARRNKDYPWWLLLWPRPEMFKALDGRERYIAIPRVAKHHLCVPVPATITPGDALVVVARDDDATMGILQSRVHRLWSLGLCSHLGAGNDPRYTPSSTFETFPFPEGFSPADTAGQSYRSGDLILPPVEPSRSVLAQEIAHAAFNLNRFRENWLNPAEWSDRVPEVVPGYPDRIVPKAEHEKSLRKRTLTKLYNDRPSWLDNTHKTLDLAVAKAYGWTDYTPDMPDEEILKRLLKLNLERTVK